MEFKIFQTQEIETYRVAYFFGEKRYDHRAKIGLYDKNSKCLAYINFWKDPDEVYAYDVSQGGFIHIHCPHTKYPEVIDLLRNESPIYLGYNDSEQTAWLSTTAEPVGEEESEMPQLRIRPA